MNLVELLGKLEQTGFPLAFLSFTEDEKPEMPYGIYSVDNETMYADGIPWLTTNRVTVDVYTARRDLAVEQKLRSALTGCAYALSQSEDSRENRYRYTIRMEVIDYG